MSEAPEQEISRNPDGTYPPGVSGNPLGRPKTKTMKEYAREWYLNKSEIDKSEYIRKLEEKRPGFSWEMAEGRAHQSIEHTGEVSAKIISVDE